MRGFFITVEGIDGTGKSTLIANLLQKMRDSGYDVLLTKEPVGQVKVDGELVWLGSGLKPIREMLFKDPGTQNLGAGVADCLLLADHIQVTEKVIKPALKQGKIVICDRYADSQFAYSASPEKRTPKIMNEAYTHFFKLKPDMTVLIAARGARGADGQEDISWLQDRTRRIGTHEEGKQDGKAWAAMDAQRRIQNAYLYQLIGQSRTCVVDLFSTTSQEQVLDAVWTDFLRRQSLPTVCMTQPELFEAA